VDALRASQGSKDGAAYMLGISRTKLYRKIKELEIRPEEWAWWDRAA
jgi:DNA-binding NtrC family response regulator